MMSTEPDPKRPRAECAAPVMSTSHWLLPADATREQLLQHDGLRTAAALLAEGQVVAFPTETVYGLGCDCTNEAAIQRVYAAKGRPSDNPLIAHVASEAQAEGLAESIPAVARTLMAAFWPGPLTLVLKVREGRVSDLCTAGLGTVGIRMPNHPVALALIEASGCALGAPSANTSGRPSPTTAAHVADDLDGKVAGLLDGGATGVGLESTVLDCTSCLDDEGRVTLLRPGGVTRRMLEEVLKESHPTVTVQAAGSDKPNGVAAENEAPRAPGMKYTHYAPKAPLHLVDGDAAKLRSLAEAARANGQKVGIICAKEDELLLEGAADQLIGCGSRADLETVAARLFAVLREFDALKGDAAVDQIFCQDFSKVGEEGGLRDAIGNRLNKAAGGSVLK